MSVNVIERFPTTSFENDATQKTRNRSFWVFAPTFEAAIDLLQTELGVYQWGPYRDHLGNMPDSFLQCTNLSGIPVSPLPDDGGVGLWTIDARYGYTAGINFTRIETPNLTPIYWLEDVEESIPADIDANGNPITNAAGEPIDPPLTVFKDRETLVIRWHKWGTDWATVNQPFRAFKKRVNLTTYAGAPPRCLLCRSVLVEEQETLDITRTMRLFRITARLEFREPFTINSQVFAGWDHNFVNRGRRIKTTDANKPYQFIRETMTPTGGNPDGPTTPMPMLIAPDGFSRLANTAQPNFIARPAYLSIDFAGLVQ